jgi:hypothetical protein
MHVYDVPGKVGTVNIENMDEGELVTLVDALQNQSKEWLKRARPIAKSKGKRYRGNEHMRMEELAFHYSMAAQCATLAYQLMWEYDNELRTMGWVGKDKEAPAK